MSKGNWGADTTDERKPTWPWVSEYIGYANCFATGGGWTVRWPWGDEVIVALSNLTTKLGTANESNILVYALPTAGFLVNAAAQSLQVQVNFNEAVHVTGTPTLVLISTVGAANGGDPANVTLSYNATASALDAGRVVFGNDSFSLASAGYGDDSLVANSTSVVGNWDTIHDAASGVAVANGIPTALSLSIPVYQEKPVHELTLRVGTAKDTANQYIGFELDFSSPVVVTGAPYVIAIGPNTDIANTACVYDSATSNIANGQIVFKSAAKDFSTLTGNCQFTLTTNGASTNASDGWAGITGVAPVLGVVSHGVIVANTFTIVQNEPFLAASANVKASANVTNAAAQVITFGITFDRAAVVTGGIPTVRAIGNGAYGNVTLSYASGNGTANLVFSSAALDLSAAANDQAWFVNASSVITGFNYISNTGVASDLTGTLTGATSNHVHLINS